MVQPQALLTSGTTMFEGVPNKARRIATVLGPGLIKLLTKPLSVSDNLSLFDDMDEARAGLLRD